MLPYPLLHSLNTRYVSREIKRKSLTSAVAFTTDQVTKGISSGSNTRAFGPEKLSIFHPKHLGSRGIEYLTALFNDSGTSCRILSILKSSTGIPITKPGKNSPLSTSYRSVSLLCPAAKCMEALLFPTVNNHLLPSANTVSDPDTLPLLLCYNWRVISRQVSTKRNLHIVQSVSLWTWRGNSIQSTTTYCYQIL